ATTGRISSETPNLQNIPVRTADGREMRRAFIPAPACELLVADYSQIELRLLAHLAQDPGLIDAFRRDADVHAATAAQVFSMAQNAPVQGGAADIFKLAMVNLDRQLEDRGLRSRMVLTVHDEVVLEVPLEEHDEAVAMVPAVMESVCQLDVPLRVDVATGPTW